MTTAEAALGVHPTTRVGALLPSASPERRPLDGDL